MYSIALCGSQVGMGESGTIFEYPLLKFWPTEDNGLNLFGYKCQGCS